MQWFINYAFLALDCPIPVVYALICEKTLVDEDIEYYVLLNRLFYLAGAKYGVLPMATMDTFPMIADAYLYRLGDEYSVHRANGSAIWISKNYRKEYAITRHTGECALPRIPLRWGYWRTQLQEEFNFFTAQTIPTNPSRDEST